MEGSMPDKERRLNDLYIAIISRYKEYIEEKEGLSVAELPTLVTPDSERVKDKAEEIKSKFLSYSYDNDFYGASIMAYDFAKNGIEDVVLPLQFWLTPDETILFMMGDIMDKSILLCSILIRLGNPSARVFVKIDEGERKVSVYYGFSGKIHAFENIKEAKSYENREEMLKGQHFGENTTAYEFNNQMYADMY
jgi:hypothetical protein